MIFRSVTDGDSNRTWKRHSGSECMVVKATEVESCLVIRFGPSDLKGVMTSHNDALVIWSSKQQWSIMTWLEFLLMWVAQFMFSFRQF